MIANRGCIDGTFKTRGKSVPQILYHLMIRLRVGNGFPFMEAKVGGQWESSTLTVWLATSCHLSIDIQHACVIDSAVCCACTGDAELLLQSRGLGNCRSNGHMIKWLTRWAAACQGVSCNYLRVTKRVGK